jgi:adenylate cyclase
VRDAISAAPALSDHGFRFGLGLGAVGVDGVFLRVERPGFGAAGTVFASRAYVEAARAVGLADAFDYVGWRRRDGDPVAIEAFRLLGDGRFATAAAAPRLGAAPPIALSDDDRPTLIAPAFRRAGAAPVPRWLCEGLAADVAGRLARARSLAVFARDAAERAAPPGGGLLDAARRLGARYALDGDLAQTEGRLRAGVRLLDVASGQALWSAARLFAFDRLDAAPAALAEELAAAIVGAVETQERMRPRPGASRVYELELRAEAAIARDGPGAAAAADPIEAALALDPDRARALTLKAVWLMERWRRRLVAREQDALGEALGAAERAAVSDPLDARALAALAEARRLCGDEAGAAEAAETAVRRDPAAPSALAALARVRGMQGRAAEAEAALTRAMRLDPFYPDTLLADLGAVRFNAGDAAGAVEALSRMADPAEAGWLLAAALAALGDTDAAAAAARRARAACPGETPERLALALAIATGAPRARLTAAFV